MAGGDGDDPVDHHRDTDRVRRVYDDIASHFSKTRAYAWPEVETFVESCESGARGLDVGCGNGRHMTVLDSKVEAVVGVDVSRNLLQEARKRRKQDGWHGELLTGNAASLPLRADCVDVAVYVATIHHLPDQKRRRASLNELARVLRDGGRALVSAWSTAHDRFDVERDAREGFDTTVDWTLPGGETVPRFYHIYAPAEFDADLAASNLRVVESVISSGNCYATVTVDDEGKRP